jgi:hemoglobin
MQVRSMAWLLCAGVLSIASLGCGDDDDDTGMRDAGKAGSGSGGKGGKGGSGGSGSAPTLCEKYGGTAAVASVVAEQVIPAIAGDCRISPFFTSLPAARLTHVVECLSIQTEELFGCEGVVYQGSKDKSGAACRTMAVIHEGLGISSGDFDALLEDVVAGMTKAGVESADIAMAAPALIGLKADIVEKSGDKQPTSPTAMCEADGGVDDAGAGQ